MTNSKGDKGSPCHKQQELLKKKKKEKKKKKKKKKRRRKREFTEEIQCGNYLQPFSI